MQRLLILLCSSFFLSVAASSAANAQFYIGGHGGAIIPQDSDISGGGNDGTASFDLGYAVGGIVGYRFGVTEAFSIDVEGEFAYRNNDIDSISVSGFPDSDGESQSFAWMLNSWLHWEIGDSGFIPYVGGGFGGVHIDINNADVGTIALDHESDFVIGGQVGGGLGYMIDEHLEISLDYRFLMTDDANMNGVDVEYQSHSAMLGLKYLF
jgi:opacity protein-like surface antigen